MDIRRSEMAYLGHYAAEAYGLTWKVSGNGPGLYDRVDVLGEVTDSHIHHNYFGIYTYGGHGIRIVNNQINDNVMYGIDPHDDSDFLLIDGNDVHDNGTHGIICSQRCDNIVIRNNFSHDNGGNGIMLHRNTNDSLVEGNLCRNNADSGLAVFDSHRNVVRRNILQNN